MPILDDNQIPSNDHSKPKMLTALVFSGMGLPPLVLASIAIATTTPQSFANYWEITRNGAEALVLTMFFGGGAFTLIAIIIWIVFLVRRAKYYRQLRL